MSASNAAAENTYKVLPWIAAVAFFMQTLDSTILNTALPKMAKDLHESPLNMQTAIICYALTVALFIPISGFLSSRFGTRTIFMVSLGLFAFGSLCSAASPSLFWLDVSRIIQGIGGAMMVPVSRLVLLQALDRDQFLDALNTSTLLGLVGPFVGPILGGYLVDKASWHWIFLINVPIGALGIFAAWKYMPNIKGKKMPLDMLGVFLVSGALIAATLSIEMMTEVGAYAWPALIFVVGVVLLVAYIKLARRRLVLSQKSSIFPIELFQVRTFGVGMLSNVVSRLGAQAIPFLLPLFLQLGFGYTAIESGLMLMPIAVASIAMKKLITVILRRWGYRAILFYTTWMVGGIILSLALIGKNSSPIFIGIVLFLFGFINTLRFTSMSSITLADLYDDQASSGNSMMAVSQQLAISFGIGLAALLVRVFQFHEPLLSFSMENAFRATFVALGLITCVSSFIFLRLSTSDGKNLTEKHTNANTSHT